MQQTSDDCFFDDVVARTKYLFVLDESSISSVLLKRYALFKAGAVSQREWFLSRLCKKIFESLGTAIQASPTSWAITTPSVNEFAHEAQATLADEFRLPVLSTLDISREAAPGTDYSGCPVEERIRIARTFFNPVQSLTQDRILLVDDMLTTGTALRALASVLKNAGIKPHNIYPFVFLRSHFTDETSERKFVDDTLSVLSSSALATIVNHRKYCLTSATMLRLLCRLDEKKRKSFWTLLHPQRQKLLCMQIAAYYKNYKLPDQLQNLLIYTEGSFYP